MLPNDRRSCIAGLRSNSFPTSIFQQLFSRNAIGSLRLTVVVRFTCLSNSLPPLGTSILQTELSNWNLMALETTASLTFLAILYYYVWRLVVPLSLELGVVCT